MNDTVKLLTLPTNYAVVQLPTRNFPGVVFQGDSLHSMLATVTKIQTDAEKYNNPELSAEIEGLREVLADAERRFVSVCKNIGIELPFTE